MGDGDAFPTAAPSDRSDRLEDITRLHIRKVLEKHGGKRYPSRRRFACACRKYRFMSCVIKTVYLQAVGSDQQNTSSLTLVPLLSLVTTGS